MKLKTKVQARELVSAGWIILITFLIGIPIVFIDYGSHGQFKEILLFIYMFLEFLPMVLYLLAIILPYLSPHLLLPWTLVNTLLLLIASILTLSLSISTPTLPKVLLALAISVLLIFPVLCALLMYLPVVVYTKKLVPTYKKKIKRSALYRKVTRTKTAEEVEAEILQRRREQVKNTVITERDFEQFIYVNRAAQKWKSKLKKNRAPEEELKDILEEGTITVNQSYELDCIRIKQDQQRDTDMEPLITNGDYYHPLQTTVYDNGKFVTDV